MIRTWIRRLGLLAMVRMSILRLRLQKTMTRTAIRRLVVLWLSSPTETCIYVESEATLTGRLYFLLERQGVCMTRPQGRH
ncbi:hypothetical protein BRADI_5g02321v3 [Brachypodium distachyon]|uniref:Secreted protein n=1 Tax=Brachypodium distachyon TaxID=15368 RepID=A0A2K2CF06_BRADI|nr:hypothetical protein BRADI_5g02321v3 [Brachypodium distachyon]